MWLGSNDTGAQFWMRNNWSAEVESYSEAAGWYLQNEKEVGSRLKLNALSSLYLGLCLHT